MAVERVERSIAHHPKSETNRRPAVENLVNPGTHLQLIYLRHGLLSDCADVSGGAHGPEHVPEFPAARVCLRRFGRQLQLDIDGAVGT